MTIERLAAARHPLPEWAAFIEVRAGTGYGSRAEQRFDVAAFNCYPSNGGYRVVYEVKRSRSDFLRELAAPGKRVQAERFFHETWFAVDRDVCKADEVPDGWGLLVLTKAGDRLRTVKRARPRTPEDAPYSLCLSVLRSACVQAAERPTFDLDGQTLTEDDLERLVEQRTVGHRENLRLERDRHTRAALDLELARDALAAPLSHLARAAGELRRFDVETLTARDVDALIERAVERRARRLGGALQTARESIQQLEVALSRAES